MEFFWVAIPLPSSRFCLITERTAVTLWFCLVFPGSGGCWLQPFCHDPPFFYPGLFSGLFGPARRHRLFRRCDLNGWSVNDEFFQAGDIINVTWISFRDVDVYIYIYIYFDVGTLDFTSCLCTYFIGWIYDLTWGSQKVLKKSKCRSRLLMEEII